ncbi:MAG TPA: penicillin-binding protein 2 [Saprospiraceae bacterium]|nr:penicillin-binding protein 2 [Saprospiraceae bacterium]HMP25444.1 penicillin-binding protein 2 [Saprospiraceae bacterium]
MSDNLRNRQSTIQVIFLLAAIVLLIKAVEIQLIDDTFRRRADATAIQKYTIYPARGTIYDRNGKLLIYNTPTYDLMATYNQIKWDNFDTTRFCQLLNIDKKFFADNITKNWRDPRYSRVVPFVFMSKLSPDAIARFQENMFNFPGFYLQLRNARGYPHPYAAHLLGYIREVNPSELTKDSTTYQMGDYIGASGLEHAYEEELRGKKGIRFVLKDNLGRDVGEYLNGSQNIAPVSGEDIIASVDLDLQAYGEQLLHHKIGSVVAIDPRSGEILAMVSSPTYDPNVLTINENRSREYARLLSDPNNIFLDRAVQGMYPPGSLFKPTVALIALQEGVLSPNRTIGCGGGYYMGGQRLTGCHGHPTCTNVTMAIQHSCNAYFVQVFRDVVDSKGFYNPQAGLDIFNSYLDRMGLGRQLGVDFPNEKAGNYPTSTYYNDRFERQQAGQKWNSVWVRSVGIGQGEMLLTTLQMANLGAIIANRGYYITPHLLKSYGNKNREIPERFQTRNYVGIDSVHFGPVVEGMERAVLGGTARVAYVPDLFICGKTGTAENPHGKDHSIFFSFAPKDDPKIAIAVYVENAGFGATFAAPIASLMIEKYLNGSIRPDRKYLEDRILNADLINKKP